MAYGCRRDSLANEDSNGIRATKIFQRPRSSRLIAMPMTPMRAGLENSVTDYPRNLITDGSQSTGVPTVLWTIGGALITALVLVGLVAPPGPTTDPGTSSRTGYSHTPRGAHI